MGQHKFDRQFSEKLREREIKPKAESWDKLNSRLGNENRKFKSLYWISGIAASVAAAVLISGFIFSEQPVTSAPVVVDTPSEEILETPENIPENKTEFSQVALEETSEAEDTEKEENPELIPQKTTITNSQPHKTEIALADSGENLRNDKEPIETQPEIIEQKVISPGLEEVIAEVSARINEEGDLQESEIDILLYQAAAQISLERSQEQQTAKVDANSLLEDVELELEQSFRDKVFDILKDSYLKARTAVANRNF